MTSTEVKSFRPFASRQLVDGLRLRLSSYRPPAETFDDWSHGTSGLYLRDLRMYWRDAFDWQAFGQRLNAFPNFITKISGYQIHFVHVKGEGKNSVPILLTHGWPSTYLEMERIIPLLTRNIDGLSFDVVVPSVPGFGFSSAPSAPGFVPIHTLFVELMERLGYDTFVAHAGDIGAGISSRIARYHPERLLGLSLLSVVQPQTYDSETLTEAERNFLTHVEFWNYNEGGYAHQQRTKPQTLAFALSESPAGLAAWITEKFHAWSDCDGDIEQSFSKDDLLAHISLYWITNTIGPSLRYYYDLRQHMETTAWDEYIETPTAIALFPADIALPPREWVARMYNVVQYEVMSRGGHFGAFEEPALLDTQLRRFAAMSKMRSTHNVQLAG